MTPHRIREPRLAVRRLTVDYAGHRALQDVDVDIATGEILALVGPSGCGKSTFLTALNRMTDLVPSCRVSGSIELDGVSVLDPRRDLLELRRRIGLIFQRPTPFPLDIRRNLTLPLLDHGIRDRRRVEDIVERSLRDVGLWTEVKDRLHRPAMQLSGGQQQRLCIARALALDPEIILFDEPCSALDPLAAAVVEDLIASLRQRYAVVIVTHNLAQARRIADRTALFWVRDGAGQLVEIADTTTFFGSPVNALTRDYVDGSRG